MSDFSPQYYDQATQFQSGLVLLILQEQRKQKWTPSDVLQ